jgi:hypothetical protein
MEGLGKLKNPITATFRLVACLKQLRYRVTPTDKGTEAKIS